MLLCEYVTHLERTLEIERWRVLFQQLPVGKVLLTDVTLLTIVPANVHQRPGSVAPDGLFELLFEFLVHLKDLEKPLLCFFLCPS